MKYFGSLIFDDNHPNYKLYQEKMSEWYTSSERYWLAFEESKAEGSLDEDWDSIACDKYHAWKDDQL